MFNTTDVHNINQINVAPAEHLEGWWHFDCYREGDLVLRIEAQLPIETDEGQRKLDLFDDLSNDSMPSTCPLVIVQFFEGCTIRRRRHNDFSTMTFEQSGHGWATVYLEDGAQVIWYLGSKR